jgi:hypothetical protein
VTPHMDASAVMLWRCEGCGKWSTAKRRPLRHLRIVHIADGDYDRITEEQVCGPFRRFVATPTDDVGPALPEHGRVTDRKFYDDPNVGIEAPF